MDAFEIPNVIDDELRTVDDRTVMFMKNEKGLFTG